MTLTEQYLLAIIKSSCNSYIAGRTPTWSFKRSRITLKRLQKRAIKSGMIKDFGHTSSILSWKEAKIQCRVLEAHLDVSTIHKR